MKLVFLGTAAAEGIPGLWCGCRVCREARKRGGKDLRRRCSYLIDNDTMIDFGPDSFWQSQTEHIDLPALRRIIFTHPHGDHLSPEQLYYRHSPGFCVDVPEYPLDILASKETMRELVRGFINGSAVGVDPTQVFDYLRLRPTLVKPGVWTSSDDVEMLPVPASHALGMGAMIYAIRRGGRTVLIANDTGDLAPESWAMLEGVKLDAAVIECTMGLRNPNYHLHLGFDTALAFRRHLVDMGCLASDAPVYANHFSHNGEGLHDELQEKFAPHGITVAYDGLSIEI